MDLPAFRARVQAYRRPTGRPQQELARELGLHPKVLSHKLHGSDGAVLTHTDIKGLIKVLARWEGITTRAEALELLALAGLRYESFSPTEWTTPPLNALLAEPDPGHLPNVALRPAARAHSPTPSTPRIVLPTPATPFVGRGREVALVRSLLTEARLLTLTGVGGAGKTRLALEAAREVAPNFVDGVVFVGLASIRDEALVPLVILRALGLPESAGVLPAHQLAVYLQDKMLLLVLDNLEQVLPASTLIGELLATAPRLWVLATSRIRLRLYGEHEVRVRPLQLPASTDRGAPQEDPAECEAVQLFAQRARAAVSDFRLTPARQPIVAQICVMLDGLPLAIELAAARSRLFPPEALLPRLQSRLKELTGGPRNLPPRQQTLRQTLDWSYVLLRPAEQHLFARLSVFAGGCDGADAVAVLGSGMSSEEMLEQLAGLADQGLLEPRASETPRFRMLETVREYALLRLVESGERDAVCSCHARHFSALAEAAEPELMGPAQGWWQKRLELEHDNLRAALMWTLEREPALALRLAGALWRFWFDEGHYSEGEAWLTRALASTSADDGGARAKAYYGAAAFAYLRGETQQARLYTEQCLALARTSGNTPLMVRALRDLGTRLYEHGEHSYGKRLLEESVDRARQAQDKLLLCDALCSLATVALDEGLIALARPLLEESLALSQIVGDQQSKAYLLALLGRALAMQGEYERAYASLRESLIIRREMGNKARIAACLEGLAGLLLVTGEERENPSKAAQLLGIAEHLREAAGVPVPPLERPFYDHIVATTHRCLDAAACAAAWTAGQRMSLEEAMSYALEDA